MLEREKLLEWAKTELPKLLREDEEFRTLFLATLIQYLPTREEFHAILKRLEGIEAELVLLRTELVELRRDFGARIERLEEEQVALRHELVELRRDFGTRIERLEAELVELRRDFHVMQQTIAGQQEAIQALQRTVAGQQEAIQALQQTIAGQQEVIEALQQAVAGQQEAIQALQQTIARQQEAIQALQQAVAEQQEAIRSLQQTIMEHQEAIRSLQQAVIALAERLERVEGRLEEVVAQQAVTVEEVREVRRGLSRLGIVSEEVVRKTLQAAVEEWLKAGTVKRLLLADREVDVVIRDADHILLEITARAHLQDIEKLKRSAEEYERQWGVRPRLAIACAYVAPPVLRRLMEEGIEVISAELPE